MPPLLLALIVLDALAGTYLLAHAIRRRPRRAHLALACVLLACVPVLAAIGAQSQTKPPPPAPPPAGTPV